jgi:hypothetical protein
MCVQLRSGLEADMDRILQGRLEALRNRPPLL